MIRRAYIAAILALGLALAAVVAAPGVHRFVSSARTARHYFNDLKSSGNSLNSIERFVFSLVLANTKTHGSSKQAAEPSNRS